MFSGGFFEQPLALSRDGVLSFRLGPHSWGHAYFWVQLSDDGSTDDGGIHETQRIRYEINVLPSRNLPTFTFASPKQPALESSGPQTVPRFISAISTGPAMEFLRVVDDSFVVTSDAVWFTVLPSVSRVGTLVYTLAPQVFGQTYVQVSLTAYDATRNISRTNTQQFMLGILLSVCVCVRARSCVSACA